MFVNSSFIYADENVNFFNIDKYKNKEWLKIVTEKPLKENWFSSEYFKDESPNGPEIIALARKIRNINQYQETIGVMRVDILKSVLLNTLNNAKSTETGLVYIINSNNELIASTNNKLPISTYTNLLPMNTPDDNSKPVWQDVKYDNKSYVASSINLSRTDWKFVSVIPYEEIIAPSKNLRNFLFFLIAVIIVASLFLAYFISKSITKRITLLIDQMNTIQSGDLSVKIKYAGEDEIGVLTENFKLMLDEIKIMLDDQYKTGRDLKAAELKALQSQINPHFLYNTLDFINWTAMSHNAPQISSMVLALAKFYKLSLSRGKDLITLQDELTLTQLYVKIQNMRFSNKIELIIEEDETAMDVLIPKITLQPIIENAILHGILEKEDPTGKIEIVIKNDGEKTLITVVDNGKGMSKEILESLLSENPKNSSSRGYGARNIHNRIQLQFGSDYGLTYNSTLNVGTTVEILIPSK